MLFLCLKIKTKDGVHMIHMWIPKMLVMKYGGSFLFVCNYIIYYLTLRVVGEGCFTPVFAQESH